ncbi:MAG: hypothetical protein KIS94_05955 [Chitinophagales bacterium]|nr:hypothetical protein [Chitinophagales bacterium]
MSKSLSAILMVICLANAANAQFFIGMRGSAYGGITNVNYNPAIANSPYLVDVNLIGVAATVNNNYVGVHRKALLHPSNFSNPDFQNLYLHERVNGKDKRAYAGMQVQGPLSFMFSFGTNKNRSLNAIGFSYHANAVMNADNVTEVFARTAYHGLGYQANSITNYLGRELYNANLSLKSAVWNDFGITYSRVVYNRNGNLIKAGGTLKLLQPITGGYGYVKDLSYRWTEYEQLDIYNTEAKYAYSDNLITSNGNSTQNAGQNLSSYLRRAMAFKAGTPTAAVDMGVVYEWFPDKKEEPVMDCQCQDFSEKRRYKLAAGFSVIDVGALRFKRSSNSSDFYADIRNWNVGNAQFPDGLQSLDDTIRARFEVRNGSEYFTMWLPTRFNLFVDYNIVKDFGVAFTAMISPDMSPQKRMVHHVSTFAITGKYENKWLGVYVPLSYDVFGNVSLGTTLRLGPLTIGTQDLLGLFAKKFVYNADIHAALKLTIPHGKICKKGDVRFVPKTKGAKRNDFRSF